MPLVLSNNLQDGIARPHGCSICLRLPTPGLTLTSYMHQPPRCESNQHKSNHIQNKSNRMWSPQSNQIKLNRIKSNQDHVTWSWFDLIRFGLVWFDWGDHIRFDLFWIWLDLFDTKVDEVVVHNNLQDGLPLAHAHNITGISARPSSRKGYQHTNVSPLKSMGSVKTQMCSGARW